MNKTKETIANEGKMWRLKDINTAINTNDGGNGAGGSVNSSTVKEACNNHVEATNRFKIGDNDNSNKSKRHQLNTVGPASKAYRIPRWNFVTKQQKQ